MANRQSTPPPSRLPEVPGVEFRLYPHNHLYAVGNDGSVYTGQHGRWTRKKFVLDGFGYERVTLFLNRRRRPFPVHRIVMETFVSDRPDGMQCRHLDGNKRNNRLSNLQWGTGSENMQDCVQHGTLALLKYTPEEVRAVIDSGLNLREAAKLIGCSVSYVSRLRRKICRRLA